MPNLSFYIDWSSLGWLFAAGVLVHNAEEAVLLPDWSARAGRWHVPVGAPEFRFAVAVLTCLAFYFAWLSATVGAGSVGAYLLSGYALAMVLNVFVPHLFATIALGQYAPGTATAVLLNLPLGGWLVYRALAEGRVRAAEFALYGPLTVIAIVALIPLLFALGKRLGPRLSRRPS